MAKIKLVAVDGLGPKEANRIRAVNRQAWHQSSLAKKLVLKRCSLGGDYYRCEECKKKVPKIQVDHIEKVGDVNDGFISRLWCPSSGLRGLCKACHQAKTNAERKAERAKTPKKRRIKSFL